MLRPVGLLTTTLSLDQAPGSVPRVLFPTSPHTWPPTTEQMLTHVLVAQVHIPTVTPGSFRAPA